MRQLPNPRNLIDAVRYVIESTRADGYTDGTLPDLLTVCIKLINKGETLEYLDNALRRFPMLLTLEDLVWRRGSEWGFDLATIETARARSEYFDLITGRNRYGGG